jgi:plastocyanin
MKPHIAVIVSLFAITAATAHAADESADKGQQLASDLWKASGGENWAKVKEVHFTFAVEQDGKSLFSAQHVWNVAAGTDEVKWKDKQGKDHQVTANLVAPPSDDEGKTAYARWVNDSSWLLAPLKIRDRGVKVEAGGPKDLNGVTYETLRLSFDQVGLTPTDQYVFYLDPQTKLPHAWDYIPKSGEGMQATWEKFQTFGGLNLATEHNFNGKTIKLADIKVVTDK